MSPFLGWWGVNVFIEHHPNLGDKLHLQAMGHWPQRVATSAEKQYHLQQILPNSVKNLPNYDIYIYLPTPGSSPLKISNSKRKPRSAPLRRAVRACSTAGPRLLSSHEDRPTSIPQAPGKAPGFVSKKYSPGNCGVIWFGMVDYGLIWLNLVEYGLIWFSMVKLDANGMILGYQWMYPLVITNIALEFLPSRNSEFSQLQNGDVP